MSTQERIVEVMGTTAHVIVTGAPEGLADAAVERLEELEARWSRFRADSEISRLNERPGVPVVVSPETFTLVERAVAGWHITAGRFDPTLLRELCAAGYDRSFEGIRATEYERPDAPEPVVSPRAVWRPAMGRRAGVASIGLDPIVRSVRIEPGAEIDPGGVGKGLAADLVVDLVRSRGAQGALVSVGGDLRAEGEAPEGRGWVVAVADPSQPDRVITTLALEHGAVASTWRTKRVWSVDGTPRHHIIDPSTGVPAETGLAGVTVVSGAGWHAEVLAKAAFLAGTEQAAPLLDANGAAGIAVTDDGTVRELGDVGPFTVSSPRSTTALERARR